MQHLIHILFVLFASLVITLPMSAKEQYVDPVFGDTIDRSAEDFVKVSLMIADPGALFSSVLGHACLRMQCPVFGLDACYSYESEDISSRVLDFLMGKIRMGLFELPTADYCAYYEEAGRGVREYQLNLPPHVKQNLWRILDEEVAKGAQFDFDYYQRGCAISCVRFVRRALGEQLIQYHPSLMDYAPTARELVKKYTENARWTLFYWGFIVGEEVSQPLHGDAQLLMPEDLVQAWQQATVAGKPLLVGEPNILVVGEPQRADGWFTPAIAMVLLLLLTIANLFWSKPYFDWVVLALQTTLGVVLIYLMYFSNLCCTSWNWLLIPFNPLPAIFWYWRKCWALPCLVVLGVWCVIMTVVAFWGHVIVDWSHIMLVIAWMLILLKQSPSFYALFTNNKCRII